MVTTGSTRPDQIASFPYGPTRIEDSVADLVPLVETGEI
jgi:NagD protein